MTGSASQAMDVVCRLLLGEKIIGRGSRGREELGVRPRREAGGLREAKEMIISKRTVGSQHLRPRETLVSIEMEGGRGSGEGGGARDPPRGGGWRITGSEGDDKLQADCWSRASANHGAKRPHSQRGEGSGERGYRFGFSLHRSVAVFENRAPVEAGRPFLKIKVP